MGSGEEWHQDQKINRWIIFLTLSAVYFLAQFHRVSPAVLSVYLADSFKVSATSLGIFSSMYFYPYAAFQPIIGILTEKHGGRKVVSYFTFLAFLGCVIFSFSRGMVSASLGRILVGIGVAGVYVPGIAILASRFGPNEFALINGIFMTAGTIGTVGASAPLAASALYLGWRQTFWIIAAVTFALSLLSLRMLPEKEKGVLSHQIIGEQLDGQPPLRESIKLILSDPFFWLKSILLFTIFGSYFTFQGLWSYPFLVDIYKIDKIFASKILMMISIGYISSSALTGFLSDRILKSRKVPFIILTGLYTLTWWVLILRLENLNNELLFGIFYFMGFSVGGINPIIFTMVKELLSNRSIGVGIGLINPSSFVGTAIYQTITGYLIDQGLGGQQTTPIIGYYNAFLLCSITSLAAFVLTFFLKETFKGPLSREAKNAQTNYFQKA